MSCQLGIEGKIAMVTGAAGGIGQATCRVLAECGSLVAALDLDADALRTVTEKLYLDGLRATGYPVNVSRTGDVEVTVSKIEDELGPIDFLVNAAGILRPADVRSTTDEDWATTFEVNTEGVFIVSRTVVNRMIPRKNGAIVTVASNAASTARIGMAAYAASKAATVMFTKSLGLEVARHGIRCNIVSPGSTDTSMLRTLWQNTDGMGATIAGAPESFRLGIPLGKLAKPDDIASSVAFLLSEHASHITMHNLTVDGGATLGA